MKYYISPVFNTGSFHLPGIIKKLPGYQLRRNNHYFSLTDNRLVKIICYTILSYDDE